MVGKSFEKAEPTDQDKVCASVLRQGRPFVEALKVAYGDLTEKEYQKYYRRYARGWYGDVRLGERSVVYHAINMEASEVEGGVVAKQRRMTDVEVAAMLWTKDRSVRVLTSIVDSETTKPNEKITAIKELNQMHGHYVPAQVNINLNIGNIMEEVIRRKDAYLKSGVTIEGELIEEPES